MPELPEVETVRCGLIPALEGQKIALARQNRLDLRWPLPENFAARLTGRRIIALGRRSKYLLLTLGEPEGETLIVHLGMSGRFLVDDPTGERAAGAAFHHAVPADVQGSPAGDGKHDHVVLEMESGARAVYNDARRFGAMDLWPTDTLDTHPLLAHLGPEPLTNGLNAAYIADRFAGRRSSLKAALLDQRNIAGLGNIYVCEALYHAELSPFRQAMTLTPSEAERLNTVIRAVIEAAIAAGGSSLRDFHAADGALGYFQHSFSVYDREGEPCLRDGCAGQVLRKVQNARSTFYCPDCQRQE